MARKNLLDGLMGNTDDTADQAKTARVDPSRPRYATGAIGAVSESIAALKNRAVIDIDPNLVDAGGLTDRIEHDDEDHARLMDSLREYGQQVPILVRPHPEQRDRYQIVYGRRRVLALRDLGQTAKAMVRELDDHALVMAQGQENATRRDLSFIEKCNFAGQMAEAGYDRKAICDALNVDKTLISRMLFVVSMVPVDLIEAIGSAHGIGRDRWLKLARLLEADPVESAVLQDMIAIDKNAGTAEGRFVAVATYMDSRKAPAPARPRKAAPARSKVRDDQGQEIAKMAVTETDMTLTLSRSGDDGFAEYLADNLADIHRAWRAARPEN